MITFDHSATTDKNMQDQSISLHKLLNMQTHARRHLGYSEAQSDTIKDQINNDFNYKTNRFEKYSHQYYAYIHYDSFILAQHASASEKLGLVKCAPNVHGSQSMNEYSNLYTTSKVYGTFVTNWGQQRIYWSNNTTEYPYSQRIFELGGLASKSSS